MRGLRASLKGVLKGSYRGGGHSIVFHEIHICQLDSLSMLHCVIKIVVAEIVWKHNSTRFETESSFSTYIIQP